MNSADKKIWYFAKIEEISKGKDTCILAINKDNYHKYEILIQKCIDLFNSEHEWEDMWDIIDAFLRLEGGEVMYVYIPNDTPLGYVWFRNNYLYNAFMHSSRKKGATTNFLGACCHRNKTKDIKLYTDDWNIKAHKVWKKLGFREAND